MPPITIRGAENRDEVRRQKLLRDTRSTWQQILDALNERDYALFGIGLACIVPVLLPVTTIPAFCVSAWLYWKRRCAQKRETLPFRLPITANCLDRHDMLPGRQSGYSKAKGVFYMGQEHETGKQLWLKASDVLTHMLVFGTTGSGKTEYLVSMAFNALVLGSGFCYVDPKGAPKLAFQIFTMCRMLGRVDDFRVMNYNTGGKSVAVSSPKRMSNTQNPFAFASADAIQQLIVSLIPKSEGGNAIFSQNAQVIISGIIYGLVDLRDKKCLQMSTATINEYLNLNQADSLARDSRLSEKASLQVKTALRTVGWREEVSLDEQMKSNKALNEQFGYARAYFGLFLTQLGYTYGYIFNHQIGEIDMQDIIMQRRVLVVILPTLEKSGPELESLGKITLSSVRNATAVGLGDKLQGTAEDVLYSLPTDARYPFLSITDEYAAIPTPGYAEVLTQGRGLGIAAIVASQDWAGLEESDKKGANQIAANTKFKVCMKLEDPRGTWELFKALAGQVLTMRTQGYEHEAGSLSGAYYDNQQSRAELEDRIHIRDLQEQTEGEFHAFFNGEIVRGAGFYANPMLKPQSHLRIHQMLPVMPPELETVEAKRAHAKELAPVLEALITNRKKIIPPTIDDEIRLVFETLSEGFKKYAKLQPMEQTIAAFMSLVDHEAAQLTSATEELLTPELPLFREQSEPEPDKRESDAPPSSQSVSSSKQRDGVEVFKIDEDEDDFMFEESLPQPEDEDAFSTLDHDIDSSEERSSALFTEPEAQTALFNDLVQAELLAGGTPEAAQDSAQKTVDVIQEVTDYPVEPVPQPISSEQLAAAMMNLFKRN